MKYAGIDLSYTSPAIAIWDDTEVYDIKKLKLFNLYEEKRKTKRYDGIHGDLRIDQIGLYDNQAHRFALLSKWAVSVLSGVDRVYIEGYSYGSTGAVFDIAENGGVLKHHLWELGIPVVVVTPGQHKKAFTGSGAATKIKMIDEYIKRTGIMWDQIVGLLNRYAKPIDDVVDAVSVLECGLKLEGVI